MTRTQRLGPTPPGEILAEEFMKPNRISQNRLSRNIDANPRPHQRHPARTLGDHRGDRAAAPKIFRHHAGAWTNVRAFYELRLARANDWPKIQRRVQVLAGE